MSRPRLIGLLLALITLLAYLPASRDGFVDYDDQDYVTENSVVQKGLTWTGIEWAFTTGHASNWHPVTWLSHMADCELFGLNPGAHHLVSVLFHTVNAVLLLLLLFRLTGALWPSALVAALFAWHPLHVESVAWIAERKDVLSTFFALLTLLAYAKYAKENCRRCFWIALGCFTLGLMSKPMLVTLPFVMLLLDYWPLQRFPDFKLEVKAVFRLALEKWPFFLLTAVACVVTFLVQSQRSGAAVASLELIPLHYRFCNALASYGLYLLKTVWPVGLAVFYPLPEHLTRLLLAATASASCWSSFPVLSGGRDGRMAYLPVGWLWFLGTLVPVIGLVQVGSAALADRYTYFPLVGVFIAVAFGVHDLADRFQFPKKAIAAAAVLILAICLILTENQLRYWRDSETLFAHALAVTKNNHVAHVNLGVALEQKGKLNEALAEYRAAEQLAPGLYYIYYNLGVALEKRGYQAGAITNYQAVLRLNPGHVHAHINLGNCFSKTGRTSEALAQYQAAIQLDPKEPLAHVNLGTLLVGLGRFDEAMSQYGQAAQLDPDDFRPHYLMGKTLLRQGRDAESVGKFREALRLEPQNILALTLLARVLASDENPQIRKGAEAVALAEKANDLTGSGQPFVLDILAMSYAEAGRYQEALQAEQRAIQLVQAAGLKETNAVNQRLELYQSGRPYRETFSNTPAQDLPKN